MASFCNDSGIELLHAHDSRAHTLALLAVLLGARASIIVHRRVDFPVGKNILSHWKYNHPAIKRIICVSKAVKQVMSACIRDTSKLALVYSAADLSRFTAWRHPGARAAARGRLVSDYGLSAGQTLVLNTAAIAPHKDYFTFVNAAEILLSRGLDAIFFIVGADGGEEKAVRDYIIGKKLESRFIFTGFRSDVPRYMAGADLMLFTSKTEGLGTAVLEAFACGLPVVATSAGGIPEMIAHEETGLLAPPGDAAGLAGQVQRLLQDEALREKLVSQASQRLADFSIQQMAEEVMTVYRETGQPGKLADRAASI
ncbi:MAG: hypothetical protein RI973_516 [Bacteroidota bacterium]|jgi:glycosyltransferase involved in cell wall biosynthesis